MMPNMNPGQMKKMMKQLGMSTTEINAERVEIIKTNGEKLVITNPNIVRMKMQGQESFQITGNVVEGAEVEATVEVSDEDVSMVAEQAGVDTRVAKAALEGADGDLAKAILELEEGTSE